jgi:hypothetical protein
MIRSARFGAPKAKRLLDDAKDWFDESLRERLRERESIRRAGLDKRFVAQLAGRICELYPACPGNRETEIAEHACLKHSGRVGRSASAKYWMKQPCIWRCGQTSGIEKPIMRNFWAVAASASRPGIKSAPRSTRSPRAGKRARHQIRSL